MASQHPFAGAYAKGYGKGSGGWSGYAKIRRVAPGNFAKIAPYASRVAEQCRGTKTPRLCLSNAAQGRST